MKKTPAFLFLFVTAATALALTLGACGEAREAFAPKVPIGPSADHPEYLVQKFAPEDVTFRESQLFLWKKDMAPEQVARVLKQSSLFDEAKDKLFVLGRTRAERRAKFAAIAVDVVDLANQIVDLDDRKRDLQDAIQQLDSENRKPEAERDAKLIARLQKKRDRLEAQLKPVEEALHKVKAAGLETELVSWSQLETELAERRQAASDVLKPIDETVWIFNSSPITFEFKFPRLIPSRGPDCGKPIEPPRVYRPRNSPPLPKPPRDCVPAHMDRATTFAAIHNWDLNKINDPELAAAPTAPSNDFSTDDGTVGKVEYLEEGGVFTFEVYAPTATYFFKIARANYRAIDGRIHYKGDIVRCSVEGGAGRPVIQHVRDFVQCGVEGEGTAVLRRGAANLADQDVKD